MDPELEQLIEAYKPINTHYSHLYAAHQAINKKLMQANQDRSNLYHKVDARIGPIAPGTLTTNLERSRYFEVQGISAMAYTVKPVHKHTGKWAPEGKRPWQTGRRQFGSLIPMTDPNDPTYIKWHKEKICRRLQGLDDANDTL